MKNELLIIGAALFWAAYLGVIAPALISSASTELVLLGIGWFVVSAYTTYRLARRAYVKNNGGKTTRKRKTK